MQFKVVMAEMVSGPDFRLVAEGEEGELRFVNPSPILRRKGGLRFKVRRLVG